MRYVPVEIIKNTIVKFLIKTFKNRYVNSREFTKLDLLHIEGQVLKWQFADFISSPARFPAPN